MPRDKPMIVPVAYPKIPTSSPGKIKSGQFFPFAIAAAVVGPPTFAFEATYSSRFPILKNRPNVIKEI